MKKTAKKKAAKKTATKKKKTAKKKAAKKAAKKTATQKKTAKKKRAKKTAAKKTVELKTKPTTKSVAAFLSAVSNETRRKDAKALDKIMRRVSGARPKLWGSSIVGYGDWNYTYASGRSGDWFEIGFAPRKTSLVLYGFQGAPIAEHLAQLGKHKLGKGCLYISKLADVDAEVLEALLELVVEGRRS